VYLKPFFEREWKRRTPAGVMWDLRKKVSLWFGIGSIILMFIGELAPSLTFTRFWLGLVLAVGWFFALNAALARQTLVDDCTDENAGFLFLTGLNWWEMLAGNVLATLVYSFNWVLLIYPFLSLPFLRGGFSPLAFWSAVLILPATTLLVYSWRTFSLLLEPYSIRKKNLIAAMIVLPFLIPTLAYFILGKFGAPGSAEKIEFVTPYYSFLVIFSSAGKASKVLLHFLLYSSLAMTLLLVSGWMIRQRWTTAVQGCGGSGEAASQPSKYPARTVFLEKNPYGWLAWTELSRSKSHWWFFSLALVAWTFGALFFSKFVLSPSFLFIAALIFWIGIHSAVYLNAAKPIVDQKKSGALELLATTPLTPVSLLDGQKQASELILKRLRAVALCIVAALFCWGLVSRDYTGWQLGTYLAIWTFFIPFLRPEANASAMWYGLNIGRIKHRTAKISFLSSAFFQLLVHIDNIPRFPAGNHVQLIVVLCVSAVFNLIFYFWKEDNFEDRFIEHYRTLVSEPLPAEGDRRINKWNEKLPYPAQLP
jgi:hypothetical protein